MNEDDLTELLPPLRDDSSQPSGQLVGDDGHDLLDGDATAPVADDAYFLNADFDDAEGAFLRADYESSAEAGYEEGFVGMPDQDAALAAALGEAAIAQGAQRKHRFRLRRWHVIVSVVLVVMIAIVTITGSFFWNRWYRFDDAQDIQGQWYVAGTDAAIDITQDQLVFNEDTAYRYSLNAEDKTISFKLGNLDGLAHYCFFEDRKVLIIMDGENYTRWGTAGDDFLISLDNLASLSEGWVPHYPEGEGIIVLTRSPNKYGWGDYSYKIVADGEEANGSSKAAANDQQSKPPDQGSEGQTDQGGSTDGNASGGKQGSGEGAGADEKPSAGDLFASVSDIAQDPGSSAEGNAQDGTAAQGPEDAS